MSINDVTKALALSLILGFATSAAAQEATTPPAAPSAEAPAAETPAAAPAQPAAPADGVGSVYVKSTHDSWELRCVKAGEGKADPCQIYQLLKDAQGNSVAEIGIFPLPAGAEAAAGATLITPLETLLTENVVLQIDAQKARVYPFSWCDRGGCVARVGFTAEDIASLKKGNKMTMSIVPIAKPDQKVTLDISLKGFTAGFDALPIPAK
ncbi:Invasion protein IalB, involved in pathogenesis [Gemmobacter aquatilis]|uniref:Invasion protein IalB, involved in pathogenesis n=1 Tax=Gemmobacter aquatilis TaxID=933059 RepID=A0A1H8NBQ4_9RHOB|nr:invasion associated locus B family protein [Gemmobacter aquatilis]SEO26879.1 Invasion protein IalB, involved in pathogenesis [Gemmobacter aquatilis]